MGKTATVIIPAFNEAVSIGGVVHAALNSCLVGEVIVVSDGSTDATAQIALSAGARVVKLKSNLGKAQAMSIGVSLTKANTLAFLDADILNITPELVNNLIMPVLVGDSDMHVAVRNYGFIFNGIQRRRGPLLSGLRAVRREIFDSVPDAYKRGFKLETALNWSCRKLNGKCTTFVVYRFKHRTKEDKKGIMAGVMSRIGMFVEVLEAHFLMSLEELKNNYAYALRDQSRK